MDGKMKVKGFGLPWFDLRKGFIYLNGWIREWYIQKCYRHTSLGQKSCQQIVNTRMNII